MFKTAVAHDASGARIAARRCPWSFACPVDDVSYSVVSMLLIENKSINWGKLIYTRVHKSSLST